MTLPSRTKQCESPLLKRLNFAFVSHTRLHIVVIPYHLTLTHTPGTEPNGCYDYEKLLYDFHQ